MRQFYYLVLLIFGFNACTQTEAFSPEGLRKYIHNPENGLSKSLDKGEYRYASRYLPISYQVLKELDFQLTDTLQYKKLIAEAEGHHYLLFQIAPIASGKSLEKLYTTRKEKLPWQAVFTDLHFRSQKQFILTVNGVSHLCQLYHVFQELNVANGYQFLLVFQDKGASMNKIFTDDLVFQFDDKYFSKEQIQFTFKKTALNQIPRLKNL